MRIAVPRAELGRYPRQNKVAIGGSAVMLRETGLHPLRGLQFFQEESGEVGRDWVRYAAERATRAHAHALPAPRRKSDLARPYYGSGFVTRPPDRDGGARLASALRSLGCRHRNGCGDASRGASGRCWLTSGHVGRDDVLLGFRAREPILDELGRLGLHHNLHIDESGIAQQPFDFRGKRRARDSASEGLLVLEALRQLLRAHNVRDGHAPARLEHPEGLAANGRLIRRQVDDAVGDHHVGRRVG